MHKHILIKEETKKRFNDLKEKKGMTADGLIRYLIDLDRKQNN